MLRLGGLRTLPSLWRGLIPNLWLDRSPNWWGVLLPKTWKVLLPMWMVLLPTKWWAGTGCVLPMVLMVQVVVPFGLMTLVEWGVP